MDSPLCRYVPTSETTAVAGAQPDTIVTYHAYTASGLPESYTRKGEFQTRLFWNGKDQLLASVTSPYQGNMNVYETPPLFAHALDSILVLDAYPEFVYNGLSPLDVVKYQGHSIFNYPDVKATTYVYGLHDEPIATATDNGVVTYYVYDFSGQLIGICDANRKWVKRFKQHYKTEPVQ